MYLPNRSFEIAHFPTYAGMIAIITAIGWSSVSSAGKAFSTSHAKNEEQRNMLEDKDGNVYPSKRMLDGKYWLTKNLNIKVPNSYCYDNKEASCIRYGRLYTWEAAKKACGLLAHEWRLPTNNEWREMSKQYGSAYDDSGNTGKLAYKALLEGGESQFNALLSGNRDSDGKYSRLDAHGFYWTATECDASEAWFFNFARGSQSLYDQRGGDKSRAWSVRCIKP